VSGAGLPSAAGLRPLGVALTRIRSLALVAVVVALAALGVAPGTHAPQVAATPVATSDALYSVMGRVFPDPHGCRQGLPGSSPWAKGNVCAVQFIQWDEFIAGLEYLEQRFPRYVELINLREAMGDEFRSAGLPTVTLERDRRDLYVVKITDSDSPVPESERKRFAFALSIHGNERAGLEGGLRAAEDLVTWAATAPDKRILEPTDSGPTAKEVVENAVTYFIASNPDGWHRGEFSEGGVFFQRYNGNGMDLNRDFPSIGYTEEMYTPASEPETRGYMAFLEEEAGRTAAGKFAGALDLHGMVTSHSFSFTLLGGGKKDYRKNAVAVQTAISTFEDSEARLLWSPLVAESGSCPGPIPEPFFGHTTGPMCTDLWGTVWDTIEYQVTGDFASWMESPLGLDAVGIDNEMALSHLAPNNVFAPDLEQLHIDGNKGLVFSNIAALLFERPVEFRPGSRVAYVPNPTRVRNTGGAPAASELASLPAQVAINGIEVLGQGWEFDVRGPAQGVYSGSLALEATFTNLGGIGGGAVEDAAEPFALVLERFGPAHPGDPAEGWVEVARYFNQAGTYAQAGARIDLADPLPGRYRIRPGVRVGVTTFDVTFGPADSHPVPEQLPYDVANTDFFTELNEYVPEPEHLQPISATEILERADALSRFDTLVLADDAAPAVPAERLGDWVARLRAFTEGGGNLVLTDGALQLLEAMQVVKDGSVQRGVYFAGWIDFSDGSGPTYDTHPLAANVDKPGAAEGLETLDDVTYEHRHQTYEPVPLGYYVSPAGASNAACAAPDDRCDSPNWVIEPAAWDAAGGTVAGRTFARVAEPAGSEGIAGVSLGEVALGAGRIRVIGALLPPPTERNPHPYGLAAYGVTYTGYEVIANAMRWQRSAAPAAGPAAPAPNQPGSRLPATGGVGGGAAAAGVLLAGLALASVRLRRRTAASRI
jgi:hypothetical protein